MALYSRMEWTGQWHIGCLSAVFRAESKIPPNKAETGVNFSAYIYMQLMCVVHFMSSEFCMLRYGFEWTCSIWFVQFVEVRQFVLYAHCIAFFFFSLSETTVTAPSLETFKVRVGAVPIWSHHPPPPSSTSQVRILLDWSFCCCWSSVLVQIKDKFSWLADAKKWL